MTAMDLKGKSCISANDIPWENLGDGIERKILGHDDEVMMVLVRFKKGGIGSLHHHVHRQVSYIAEGSFEVTIDGEMKVLKTGDCYFVAPDLVHGVLALEDGMLVDVFAPARKDFLK